MDTPSVFSRQRQVPRLQGKTILVVEDDLQHSAMIEAVLTPTGASLTVADRAETLLADAPECDLILMDIRLPGIDGLEAARRLREAGMTVPIITISGSLISLSEERSLTSGINAHLAKPLMVDRLYSLLDTYIG